MDMFNLIEYLRQLFKNHVLVTVSAIGASFYSFFLPAEEYKWGAIAVLGTMAVDLWSKLYALKRKGGGWRKAIFNHSINSASFLRGTIDKLIIFGVMTIICGLAYHISFISTVAVWLTQMVYILMFLRDALSIIENLTDSGIKGLGIFKKLLKHKIDEYINDPELESSINEFLENNEEQEKTPKEQEESKTPEPDPAKRPEPKEAVPEPKEPVRLIESINDKSMKEEFKHDTVS